MQRTTTRATLTILPLALLAACGGMKTVDTEALAKVDAEAMVPVQEEQQDLVDAEDDLEDLYASRSGVKQQLKDANKSARDAEVDVSDTRDTKVHAVKAGDAASVEELDETIDAAQRVARSKESRAARFQRELELLDLRIDAAEIRVDLAASELELARAEAANASGAEVELDPFLKQRDALQADYDDATAEIEAMEDPQGV